MRDSTLNSLREITGEGDLNCILKSSLGGYTKKSVKEYLSTMKTQQDNLKAAYDLELIRVRSEKDELVKISEAQFAELNLQIEDLVNQITLLQKELAIKENQLEEVYSLLQHQMGVSFIPNDN
ncbi:MAG: hypothetical protein MJ150_01835 [Clostridia bacterium]|nr:hypothetical protein [Clostridia bacterium]